MQNEKIVGNTSHLLTVLATCKLIKKILILLNNHHHYFKSIRRKMLNARYLVLLFHLK